MTPNISRIRDYLIPLSNPASFSELLDDIGERRFVLIGEATHGSHEFYALRADLSKVLIEKKNFDAVVIEGDWPDSFTVNRYVLQQSDFKNANSALVGFERFPTWMWRNTVVEEFIDWLEMYNHHQTVNRKVRFYGFDLYSLFKSIDIILQYLEKHDKTLWHRAKQRFSCFDHCNRDAQMYGYLSSGIRGGLRCEEEVINQLNEIVMYQSFLNAISNQNDNDEFFSVHQNARLIKNAENYYRQMYTGGVSSWNLRDTHMMETIHQIDSYLRKYLQRPPKIIVWAHNSHLGDAMATELGQQGELNVGQLMRDQYPTQVYLLGFTSHHGYVTAASEWGGVAERKRISPALPNSYEDLFHNFRLDRFLLIMRGREELSRILPNNYLERAIGVLYLPQSERASHYFHADLARQFDAVIHIDETQAVKPLEKLGVFHLDDAPETYPSGL